MCKFSRDTRHTRAAYYFTNRLYLCSEYNEFLDELEEDPEMRQNINIFRDSKKQIPVDTNEIDPSIPQITLEEMLDDLTIKDVEMADT